MTKYSYCMIQIHKLCQVISYNRRYYWRYLCNFCKTVSCYENKQLSYKTLKVLNGRLITH